MTGILIDNPLINSKTKTIYTPKVFLGINPSKANTNEISNELGKGKKFATKLKTNIKKAIANSSNNEDSTNCVT